MGRVLRESPAQSAGPAVRIPTPRGEAIARPTSQGRLLGNAPDQTRALLLSLLLHCAVRAFDLAVLFVAGALSDQSAYRRLLRWDANWYGRVAEHGYGFSHVVPDGRMLTDYAFFPLYPALERLVAEVSGLSVLDAGLVVSAVSGGAAAAGIFMVGSRMFDARTGVVLVVLWSALPISIVQSMAYTESLFTALIAWTLYAVLRRRFLVAGVLACLAGLTRPTGGALAVAVAVAAALHLWAQRGRTADGRGWRDWLGPALAMLIAPMGTISFLAYVGIQEHDPLAYFQAADAWGNGLDGGASFAAWIGGLLSGPDMVAGLAVSAALIALGFVIYCLVRQGYPAPILVFTVVTVALAFATSGYFGSKPRYLLPVFPLLMPLAAWLRPRAVSVLVLVGLTIISGAYGAVWLFGPGPP